MENCRLNTRPADSGNEGLPPSKPKHPARTSVARAQRRPKFALLTSVVCSGDSIPPLLAAPTGTKIVWSRLFLVSFHFCVFVGSSFTKLGGFFVSPAASSVSFGSFEGYLVFAAACWLLDGSCVSCGLRERAEGL